MQNARFMVLTGHLNDYPLSDLIGILRHQRKSGRLLIEYPANPCVFYFNNGDLIDVRLGTLTDFQAVCVALSQPNAPFNFNPLIQSPASSRAIDDSVQKVILELLGSWEEKPLNITSRPAQNSQAVLTPSTEGTSAAPDHLEAIGAQEILALPPLKEDARLDALTVVSAAPKSTLVRGKRRLLMVACVTALLLLSLEAVIVRTHWFASKGADITTQASSAPSDTGLEAVSTEAKTATLPASDADYGVAASEPDAFGDEQDKERTANLELLREESRRAGAGKSRARTSTQQTTQLTPSEKIPEPTTPATSQSAAASSPSIHPDTQAVKIVMQIENGRVSQASVANHRPGMEAYEALAVRIARGRRYAATAPGQETVSINVNVPKQ